MLVMLVMLVGQDGSALGVASLQEPHGQGSSQAAAAAALLFNEQDENGAHTGTAAA
jgi:hypothetical protein